MTNYVVEAIGTRDPLDIAQYFENAHNIPIASSQRGSTACRKNCSTHRYFGIINNEYGVYSYSQATANGAIIVKVEEIKGKKESVIKMPEIKEEPKKQEIVEKRNYKLKNNPKIENKVFLVQKSQEILIVLDYFKKVLKYNAPRHFYRSDIINKMNREKRNYLGIIDDSFDSYTLKECEETQLEPLNISHILLNKDINTEVKNMHMKRKYVKKNKLGIDASEEIKKYCKYDTEDKISDVTDVKDLESEFEKAEFTEKIQIPYTKEITRYKIVKESLLNSIANDMYTHEELLKEYNMLLKILKCDENKRRILTDFNDKFWKNCDVSLVKEIVEKMNEKDNILGYLGEDNRLIDFAFIIRKLEFVNNQIYGDVEFAENNNGIIASYMIDQGINFKLKAAYVFTSGKYDKKILEILNWCVTM